MTTLNSDSSAQESVTTPSTDKLSIDRLRTVCIRVEQLSWKTRRDMACALRAALQDTGIPDEKAYALAHSTFHISPERWLGRGEILKALADRGLNIPPKRLYMLPRQALQSGSREIEVGISAAGRFVPTETGVVVLVVCRSDEAIRFRLKPAFTDENSRII